MSLLDADEPSPAIPFHAEGRAAALICCDHAGRAIPRRLGDLGVPKAALDQHIGWDIGALDVATRLAAHLDAPGLYQPYSRLVIDCNRKLDSPTLSPEVSDRTPIPGNRGLTAAQQEARVASIWRPYHQALAAALATRRAAHPQAVLISVHSFTPSMGGKDRPWEIGVVWSRDERIAVPLLAALKELPGICVGDNQPYNGRDGFGFTVPHHAGSLGLPHVMLEIRQNEIDEPAKAALWADRIADCLRPILAKFA